MKQFPTRKPPANRLLIFARVPEMGRVKSRLARDLGSERALEVYRAMLDDVLDRVGHPGPQTDIEVLWTGSEEVEGKDLRNVFGDRSLARQAGESLGDRLAVAFSERIFFHAAAKVVAIGTDDPVISREQIDVAFDLLDSCEWVIGPSLDGGYYLIGCRGAAFNSSIFREIPWGGPDVFSETSSRIRDLRATLAVLPFHRDIDEMTDLELFSSDASSAGLRTAALVRSWSPA